MVAQHWHIFWKAQGFRTVVNVGKDLETLKSGLEEQVYQTKTRVKNPDAPSTPQAGLNPKQRVSYPPEGKHEVFGVGIMAKKFMPANRTTLLNYKGAELLLIANKKQIDIGIGGDRAEDLERTAGQEANV
ncbi:hypothetical protein JB92DRAFT_2832160 [Gautieria morchelliformis]|nr:hypothetical protein JB92DRAFT_2832160 [Gautieria morchelliformis]